MLKEENILRQQIIKVGKRLYDAGLAVAKSGNLSAKLDEENMLITASGTFLGGLKKPDIVKVNLKTNQATGKNSPSSELPLHSLIYKNFSAKTVIHCHPPLINGYFALNSTLKAMTFEAKLYLGNIPVIKQETPTVTQPQLVIDGLKANNLVVLKNHGTVAMAEKFEDGLSLTEALEEAVKSAAIARLFNKEALDDLEQALKVDLSKDEVSFEMFSKEHIQAIVSLVNKDEFISQKGRELDLTLQLAIKLEETGQCYKFIFEKGKIIKLDFDSQAPFLISAPQAVWKEVFLGNLDSFVAVTQGKMKLAGQLGQLSKWYVPFTRLFALFKEVKIK